nr:hypothetical protein Hi04_10k_c5203_00011 [uncultured bacterium]
MPGLIGWWRDNGGLTKRIVRIGECGDGRGFERAANIRARAGPRAFPEFTDQGLTRLLLQGGAEAIAQPCMRNSAYLP